MIADIDQSNSEFPIAEARVIARRYAKPKPAVYWTDFLISISIGWGAFVAAVTLPAFSAGQIVAVIVSALAHYRAVLFTHELAHLKIGTFKLFRAVWNLLSGVPLMIPAYTYTGVHLDHHRRGIYGFEEDGEYVAFATGKPWRIVLYVAQIFFLPIFMAARFILLTPVSYLIPPFRRYVWKHLSSLAIDLTYERPPAGKQDDMTWPYQEFGSFIIGASVIGLVIAGILPFAVIAVWYAVAVIVFLLNSLRTLAAHAYRNPGGQLMTRSEEFLDSVNIPGIPFISMLWAPVGLRYHATHHLFASVPYHELESLHRALIAELPDNTVYLRASRKGLVDALVRLWQEARAAESDKVPDALGAKG